MSGCEQNGGPMYLQEARLRAGYISRGTAATVIPFSPETIGRHERGDVELRPEDAVIYAEGYGEPGVMRRYCCGCPVGQRIGRSATDRPLPYATLRICYLLEKGPRLVDVLEQVAFDGVIGVNEQDEFDRAVDLLQRLDESINDFLLIIHPGKEKGAAPAEAGTTPGATNHI